MSVEKLEGILEKIADIKDIKNYEGSIDEDPLGGNGFLSESYTGYVKNKDTGEIIHTYIKKIPKVPGPYGTNAYFNENYFYSSIWPELSKFQKEKCVKIPFQNIPIFYCGDAEPKEPYLCMENLKIQNFDILNKSQSIDKDILELIFDKYGKFHALTFAFKDQNQEKYTKLVSPLRDMYVEFAKGDGFIPALQNSFNAAHDALKIIDVEKANKINYYRENIREEYKKIILYKGKFSALVHGDCWSNNLLFKYRENGTIEDLKFIDFQLCRNSTPIHDLSYFFYSGASKEDFQKLDAYLELYHRSFSTFAKELGSDPEKLLPLDALKSEWKKHSLLGLFMGLVLWQVKLMQKDKIEQMTTDENVRDNGIKAFAVILKSETYKEKTSEILLHAIEYGIL